MLNSFLLKIKYLKRYNILTFYNAVFSSFKAATAFLFMFLTLYLYVYVYLISVCPFFRRLIARLRNILLVITIIALLLKVPPSLRYTYIVKAFRLFFKRRAPLLVIKVKKIAILFLSLIALVFSAVKKLFISTPIYFFFSLTYHKNLIYKFVINSIRFILR